MKLKFTLFSLALFCSVGLFAQPVCTLGNYSSITTLSANSYPYTSPSSGITVTASAVGVPTLNNFNYNCGGQTFTTVAPAWWLNNASQSIILNFSVPVTNFSVVVNGTNLNEEFYFFANNAGTISLTNYCPSGFTTINGGTALLSTQSPATGTLITVNNTVGATQYTLRHNGVGSGSRIALLDCITGGAVLPVDYLSFEANAQNLTQQVNLQWETQNEVDNAGFEVEHSFDGKSWEKVGYVSSELSRSSNATYQFAHRPGKEGVQFYRLKQIDVNGYYFYSAVREATLDALGGDLLVYPNPGSGVFSVSASGLEGHLQVSDILGKIVVEGAFEGQTQIDLSQMDRGVYLLKLVDQAGQSHLKKLIVQ